MVAVSVSSHFLVKMKVNVTGIYIASGRETSQVLRHGSHSFTCKERHACLYFVSIHQMALPLIVIHIHLGLVWLSGNALSSINVVALCQTRLVPGWVTICGWVNHLGM